MPHDPSYKEIFAHPKMVQDLLLGFVKEDWVKALDFKTLERVNASYVARRFRQRHLDMVWKIKWKNDERHPLYIYLMLEFQTKNDLLMPFRMMSYLSYGYIIFVMYRELKFKTVPPWVRTKLKSATEAQLRSWAGKILRAESLEEVFNSRKRARTLQKRQSKPAIPNEARQHIT